MVARVKNYRIRLENGRERYVAATTYERINGQIVFSCWGRIVLTIPKVEVAIIDQVAIAPLAVA